MHNFDTVDSIFSVGLVVYIMSVIEPRLDLSQIPWNPRKFLTIPPCVSTVRPSEQVIEGAILELSHAQKVKQLPRAGVIAQEYGAPCVHAVQGTQSAEVCSTLFRHCTAKTRLVRYS